MHGMNIKVTGYLCFICFFQNLYYFLYLDFLLRPRISKEYLAHQQWYAYHNLRNHSVYYCRLQQINLKWIKLYTLKTLEQRLIATLRNALDIIFYYINVK